MYISCTSLLILFYYLLSPQYTVLHILFYCTLNIILPYLFFQLYLCIFSCVVLHILHCPLSGPDLIYISLLIIFCIIEYVTNKTLNLDTNVIVRLGDTSKNSSLCIFGLICGMRYIQWVWKVFRPP